MYELSRVRLHAVGPKGARYQDVTLDLRCGPSGQPSAPSVLFLENGGGKTVLVRLIFSVILPGRRQIVGTSNSKMFEKFVLSSDVATWRWNGGTRGPETYWSQGRHQSGGGHIVSADSNRLTERWYTFRPTEALDLGTLPFTQDGRIVSLAGFHERLDEADKADSALQVRWVDRRGEWTEHLDSLQLDPELFSYQRKMNAGEGEGEAADAKVGECTRILTYRADAAVPARACAVAAHGQPGQVAALTPLPVDGMIVAASMTLIRMTANAPAQPPFSPNAAPWGVGDVHFQVHHRLRRRLHSSPAGEGRRRPVSAGAVTRAGCPELAGRICVTPPVVRRSSSDGSGPGGLCWPTAGSSRDGVTGVFIHI